MKEVMISFLAYAVAAVGALCGIWLTARWPDPRWRQWLAITGLLALAVGAGGVML